MKTNVDYKDIIENLLKSLIQHDFSRTGTGRIVPVRGTAISIGTLNTKQRDIVAKMQNKANEHEYIKFLYSYPNIRDEYLYSLTRNR